MNAIDIEPPAPAPAFRGCLFALLLTGLAIGAVQVALVAGCASSPELPEGALEFVTNYVDRVFPRQEVQDSQDSQDTAAPENPVNPENPANPVEIAWKYGGVDGSRAVETAAARIGSLRITSDGLSYKWEAGGCEALGATSRTDCDHTLACAFWWDGSRWVGGKFDWISTSRTTRDFKNIRDRYHGWDPDRFFAAKRRAFCILSKDGRKRTNLIEE